MINAEPEQVQIAPIPRPPRKRKSAVRKTPFTPTFPQGLTVREKLLLVDRPITAPVLASILGVSPITIFKKAKSGVLPCIRIGAAVRFDARQIARWLDGQKVA